MTFTSKYNIGQILYLVTDPDQLPRMVVAIQFTGDGGTVYTLALGNAFGDHYEIEVSSTVNHVQRLGINSN